MHNVNLIQIQLSFQFQLRIQHSSWVMIDSNWIFDCKKWVEWRRVKSARDWRINYPRNLFHRPAEDCAPSPETLDTSELDVDAPVLIPVPESSALRPRCSRTARWVRRNQTRSSGRSCIRSINWLVPANEWSAPYIAYTRMHEIAR